MLRKELSEKQNNSVDDELAIMKKQLRDKIEEVKQNEYFELTFNSNLHHFDFNV